MSNHQTALCLARAGFSIAPACSETKRPLVRFTTASTKLELGVDYFWRRYPDAVPAINLSDVGLVVIDLDRGHWDGADGVATFEQLLDRYSEVPSCPAVRTRRGGIHLYFRQPSSGDPIGNSTSRIGSGVDVRGFHGYVIAPGAVMADGTFYESIAGTPDLAGAFAAGTIPEIPAWLAELADPPVQISAPQRVPSAPVIDCNRRPFGVAVLEGEAAEVASAPKGSRNHQLNKAAFVIAAKAGAWGLVSEAETWDALWSACIANGYLADDGPKAFRNSFYSGWNDGVADPTPIRERLTSDPNFAERIANLNVRGA